MRSSAWVKGLLRPACRMLLTVVLIGLAKGGFTGLGALGTPLMALGMRDPVRAAAILLPILIAQDVVGVAAFRRTWSGSILAIMLPGAILGIGLGYLLAATISEAAIMAVLGGISMLFGAYRLWVERGGRISASRIDATLPPASSGRQTRAQLQAQRLIRRAGIRPPRSDDRT